MKLGKATALILLLLQCTAFANGNEDKSSHKEKEQQYWRSQGSNIVRLNIFGVDGMGTPSMGIEYERILDPKGSTALVLPVNIGFGRNSWEATNGAFSVSPGIKFYPGLQRKVTYAVGPSLYFCKAEHSEWAWDPSTGGTHINNVDRTQLGVLIKNYLNVQLNSKFCFSVDFGLGMLYINKIKNALPHIPDDRGNTVVANFNMGFGYRF